MGSIFLVSFADSKFRPTAERLRKEAESFGVFSSINIPSEKDFDEWYRKKYWFRLMQKGMGFWMWKSYIVKKYYDTLLEGDILLYVDAGCVLNYNGIKRFTEYIDLVNSSPSGILAFMSPAHIERECTKADVLHYFGLNQDSEISKTGQLYAGAFFLRKNPVADELVDNWYGFCHNQFGLLSDNPSTIPNGSHFKFHRYDQSVFSILAKMKDAVILSTSETYTTGDWGVMSCYPILAKRLKEYSVKQKIIHRIKFPIRRILDYLVRNGIIRF